MYIHTVKPVYNDHTRNRWSLYRGVLVSLRRQNVPVYIVVSVDRWSLYRGAVVSLKRPNVPVYSGLCRQVVLIQRCSSITEEANVPVYSGLCRQVILL